MKQLAFGPAPLKGREIPWMMKALRDVERASREDVQVTADAFEIDGDYTETRTLNPSTATTQDVANVVATFLMDLKQRGQNRTE